MPSRHSAIVGGSSAARVVNCPGSAALLASLPPIVNRDSVYSIEMRRVRGGRRVHGAEGLRKCRRFPFRRAGSEDLGFRLLQGVRVQGNASHSVPL